MKMGNESNVSLCAVNGFSYVPLVVDTYGAWDPSTFPFFKSVAASHSVIFNYSRAFSLHLLMTALSVSLQRSNALNLLAGRASPPGLY